MKRLNLLLLLCSLCALPSWGLGQTPAPTQVGTPNPTGETLYRFQSDTSWGPIKVLVRNLGGHFKVEVNTDSSALGWTLKEEANGRTVSKEGGLSPKSQFQFEVNRPFRGPYRLALYLSLDHEEVPVVVRLFAQNENKGENLGTDSLDAYQENPNHPYNNMVKNLYNQAAAAYGKSDNRHALELLNKAAQLDPTQPQVQALLEKIQGPEEKPASGPLDQVRKALKNGRKEEALAQLDDYLDKNPGDSQALGLKDQIEGKNDASGPLQKTLAKAEKADQAGKTTQAVRWYKKALKLDPQNAEAVSALDHLKAGEKLASKPKKLKLSDADAQAQADQAYNLGLESYRQGDYAAAKKFWEETLQIMPTHPQAQRNLERLQQEHSELK